MADVLLVMRLVLNRELNYPVLVGSCRVVR